MTMNTIGMSADVIPTWTVPDRLRKAREHTGLTGLQFAEEIGVSLRTIYRYENGQSTPSKGVLLLWQMRTGVPLEWLTTGKYTPRDLNPEPTVYGSSRPVAIFPLRCAA